MCGAVLVAAALGGCGGNVWFGYERQCADYLEDHGATLDAAARDLVAALGGGATEEMYCDDSGGPPASVGLTLDAPGSVEDVADRLTELSWVLDSSEGSADGYLEQWYTAGDGSGLALGLERFATGDVVIDVVGPVLD